MDRLLALREENLVGERTCPGRLESRLAGRQRAGPPPHAKLFRIPNSKISSENVFARGKMITFVQEGWDWIQDVARNPAVEGRFTYVWRNQAGIPKGAFTFRKEYEPGLDRATMLCDGF